MFTKSTKQHFRIHIFKALSNPARLRIIDALRKKPLTVNNIVAQSGLEQSHVSHNLRYLEKHCFVVGVKNGRSVKYKLNNETILPIVIMADEHLKRHQKSFLKTSGKNALQLRQDHICDCFPCREFPKMILQGAKIPPRQHTCNCKACIANIGAITKRSSSAVYNSKHTCGGCRACIQNQQMLLGQ